MNTEVSGAIRAISLVNHVGAFIMIAAAILAFHRRRALLGFGVMTLALPHLLTFLLDCIPQFPRVLANLGVLSWSYVHYSVCGLAGGTLLLIHVLRSSADAKTEKLAEPGVGR